jgi:hypothetical protein
VAQRVVSLAGNDVSRWVTDLPAVAVRVGEYGQVATNPIPSIAGDDSRGFWSPASPASPFFGAPRVSDYPVEILVSGVPVLRGWVQGVQSDGRAADIALRTIMQSTLEGGLIYVPPPTPVDPATTFAEICVQYNLPFDSASVAASAALYAANGLAISLRQLDPSLKILDAFQLLAEIGVARVYEVAGILYFEAWQPRTSAPLVTVTDQPGQRCTLWTRPAAVTVEKDRCEGYVVDWLGTPTATRGLESSIRRTIGAGQDAPVGITTLNGAVWVGEQWLRYLNTGQQTITFRCPAYIGKGLLLGMAIGIDYTRWDGAITADITALDQGGDLWTDVTALTRGA